MTSRLYLSSGQNSGYGQTQLERWLSGPSVALESISSLISGW